MDGPESAGDLTGLPDVTGLSLTEVVTSDDPVIAVGAEALKELLGPEAQAEMTTWPQGGQ